MWVNVPCKHCVRERRRRDFRLREKDSRKGLCPATPFSLTFHPYSRNKRQHLYSSHVIIFSPTSFSFTLNTIAYIFTIPLSLSPFFYYGGRMARKAYNIQAIDPRPSLQKKKKVSSGGGGTKGDWTQRSITYSISRFHGNRPSKDRGLPCILHLSVSYTYCDNESVRETNAKVTQGSGPNVNFHN